MNSSLFCFFISGEENQVLPGSRLWKLPLAGVDTEFPTDTSLNYPPSNTIVTTGDYFSAARQFLVKNDFTLLKSGLETVCKGPVRTNQISKIEIFLEKHGALYHPLKIQVSYNKICSCSFVLNGAVSKQGLSLINDEYNLISGLNKAYLNRYLPQVFGSRYIKTDKGKMGFFLGEWFDGYKEFHVTKVLDTKAQDTKAHDKGQIVLWDSDGSCQYISETDALEIYQEISRILTYYYNLETFEQISPWHHAAGDFIVKQKNSRFHVRLITVRGYTPITEFCEGEPDKKVHILPSLLFFFLNLTFRMRFDRLNGTGKPVMLEKSVIKAAVDGFLYALEEKSAIYQYGNLRSVFIEFFGQFTLKQIMGMMENVLESYPPYPSEIVLIEEKFDSHCRNLYSIFRNI
ncbi:MAG: hypothetical protein DRH93_04135 [Deltaproteobacteria bacterium]|nr:MAG: hypothetical protein DRH93_04135 [Deltaproteobacteria bacterium]